MRCPAQVQTYTVETWKTFAVGHHSFYRLICNHYYIALSSWLMATKFFEFHSTFGKKKEERIPMDF